MSQVTLTTLAEYAAQMVAEYVPQRVLLSVFGFMAIVNAYAMRHSLDVALTQFSGNSQQNQHHYRPQAKRRTAGIGNGGDVLQAALSVGNITQVLRSWQRHRPKTNIWKRNDTPSTIATAAWTSSQQNAALSSFYVGYALSQLPAGRLAEHYGGKWVLAWGMALTALLTLLTPLAMQVGGPVALIGLRFLMGLSEGPTYPALMDLLAHWVPSKERGKLAVLALSGGQFAQIVVTLCSTLLLRHFNWMLIFYFFGAGALVWLASFLLFCHNEPAASPFIRPAERDYLLTAIPSSELRPKSQLAPPTPWRDIFTCAPIWALISATVQHDCHQANAVTVATQHLRHVKQKPFSASLDASVQATLPTLLNWIASLVSGWASDFLVSHNWLTTTATRKFMTAISALGPNVFSGISNCFTSGEHKDVAALLNCIFGVLGSFYAGIQLTPLDLSPNYAATLMAVSNGFGALATSVAPYLETLLQRSPFKELRGIFWLFCTMLMSGDVQAFNDPSARIKEELSSPQWINHWKIQGRHFFVVLAKEAVYLYDWSQALQGFIRSSFYIGYPLTHIPGGMLAERYGGKWILAMGIMSTAFFTFITPIVIIKGGEWALVATRIMVGLGEGVTYPALSALIAHWVPVTERGFLGALILGGGQVGTVVGNMGTGYILNSMTWPWVFYIFGGLTVLWGICFLLFCYSDPRVHPFISPKEKKYLTDNISHLAAKGQLPPTPWKAILTSAPVITLVICQLGHDWGFYMMVTDLPKYMNDVLQFSIKRNGFWSSMPYVLMWFTSVGSGILVDFLVKKECTSITVARKVSTGIAAFGPAIFMVIASYAGCNRMTVVTLFIICMGLMGPYYSGMKLTPLDLSPNYAGTIMALANGCGAITGAAVPYIGGLLTPNDSLLEWRRSFIVACGVLSITAVPYMFYASGEVQEWNEPPPKA